MSKAAELAALIGSQTALSNRNIVINGAMQVAQRSTSETGQGASSGYTTLDRFRHEMGGDATAGRFTISQNSVTDLSGFSNSLKIQCTTADTSTAASEGLLVQQRFEGQNLQQLMNSSTSTKAFTLSFYAKQNETRNIVVEIRTSQGTNRQICKLFAVTSSWARYEFTVPAQASGMTIDDDNSNELQINFWLHAGSTFTGGTLDTSFAGSTNANRAVGVGSIFASTSNFIEITGVQLEAGEQATPFEHRSFHDELRRCKRYFERFAKTLTSVGQDSEANCGLWSGMSRSGNSGNNQGVMTYQTKRTNPSISVSSAAHINGVFPISPFAASLSSFGIDGNAGIDNCFVNAANNASSAPSSDCGSSGVMGNSSGTLDIDAEL